MSSPRAVPGKPQKAFDVARLRTPIRLVLLVSFLYAGWLFLGFVRYVQTGQGVAPMRPSVADAFLPLGGFAALKAWMGTGVLDRIHPAAAVVLLAILVTALLFRRAMCSWLCPVGLVSEGLAGLGKRLMGRNLELPKRLDALLLAVKYTLFGLVLLWLFALPAAAALDFMGMPFYVVADVKLFEVYSNPGVPFVAVLMSLLVLSVFVKSAWCRYGCPVGALQGILGVLSPVTLNKDVDRCTSCGACSRACPNGVDVASAGSTVVSAECMGCTSCISACPRPGTLKYRLLGGVQIKPAVFVTAFLVVFFGIALVAQMSGHWNSVLTAADYRAVAQYAPNVQVRL